MRWLGSEAPQFRGAGGGAPEFGRLSSPTPMRSPGRTTPPPGSLPLDRPSVSTETGAPIGRVSERGRGTQQPELDSRPAPSLRPTTRPKTSNDAGAETLHLTATRRVTELETLYLCHRVFASSVKARAASWPVDRACAPGPVVRSPD